MLLTLQFAACTIAIVLAGVRLSRYGDAIAAKTGLGRGWVGVALLATVTSLPELITGFSSTAIYNLPNIAAGDVFGSCMFNLFIIALIDAFAGKIPISSQASAHNIVGAALGALLLGIAGISIVGAASVPSIGWISVSSLIMLVTYLLAMRVVFLNERKRVVEHVEDVAETEKVEDMTLRRAIQLYVLNAVIIVAAATFLPGVGERIARSTGLSQSYVGSILIAFSTSLPELVVSLSSLKIGAIDMVLGNLFGSNLFDIGIFALDDIFYTRGPLAAAVDSSHLISICGAIIMTAIAIVGLSYRSLRKRTLAWDSTAMIAVYALTAYILAGAH